MPIKQLLILLIPFVLLTSCKKEETIPPKIELEAFFKNPLKTNLKISPNGKFIAYLAPYKSRMNIFSLEIGDSIPMQLTYETDRDIPNYKWANDFRIIFIKDENGNENYKLYGVDFNGDNLNCLTCYEGVRTTLIDHLENIPDEVIVGLNKRNKQIFDPYRLNIRTGSLKQLAENPGNILKWKTDHLGRLRLAEAILEDGSKTYLYRDSESEEFRSVLNVSWKDTFIPHFFTFNNKMIYASSNIGRDKEEIVIFDPQSRSESEIIFANKNVDVVGLSYSRKRKTLTTAKYITDKKKYHFFDKKTKDIYDFIHNELPDYEILLANSDKGEDKYIVRTYSDKTRGAYYIYIHSQKKLKKINDISPWLNEDEMADMQPISYTSRDGLIIHGYLTLPKGRKPENLPVIINPHGGPWTRDYWRYNPEVQHLANRGYAVLQMNYRGSTGYGKEFWLKSVKQWGKNMQNDISDGTQWLIDKKIADPKRIGIYGASYGGYATLAGLAFTPDLYACGVDYVGVSNLFTFLNTIPPYWAPLLPMFYELIGHPQKDSLLLMEASPYFHADKITSPVFIAQGKNDPRVNVNESDQIVKALKNKDVEVTYMIKENEGHGFRNEENRFDFYHEMELFLKQHLKCEK